jgi:hypothetical protein
MHNGLIDYFQLVNITQMVKWMMINFASSIIKFFLEKLVDKIS